VVDDDVEALIDDAIVRRQMESKVLDFDWISEIDPETDEPRVRQFIKILA